jgi:signal transduction histidine kinase
MWTAAAGVAFTALVALLPGMRLAYRSLPAHVALDSIEAVIALLVGYITLGRFRQSSSLSYLLLSISLFLLGITNIVFSVGPLVVFGSRSNLFSLWGSLTLRMIATSLLAYAAVRHDRVEDPERALWLSLAAIAGLPLATGLIFGFAGDLPTAVGAMLVPEVSTRPRVHADFAILAPQLLLFAFYVIATFGYTRRAEQTRDPMWAWIAAACTLGALTRINYVLFPSIYTQWLYTGDFLRFGFYLLLLVGATGEIQRYWNRVADMAVLDERRRLARDVHDGLSQELAFIVAKTKRYRDGEDKDLSRVSAAADRALNEARHAFRALTPRSDLSDRKVFESLATDVEVRTGKKVRVDFTGTRRLAPDVRRNLVRIAQEALNNASRHSGAEEIFVRVTSSAEVTLSVSDQGRGFDPKKHLDGFGLMSMRERAENIGATLSVASDLGVGTLVEVWVPSKE